MVPCYLEIVPELGSVMDSNEETKREGGIRTRSLLTQVELLLSFQPYILKLTVRRHNVHQGQKVQWTTLTGLRAHSD